jgi:hypothetical protein
MALYTMQETGSRTMELLKRFAGTSCALAPDDADPDWEIDAPDLVKQAYIAGAKAVLEALMERATHHYPGALEDLRAGLGEVELIRGYNGSLWDLLRPPPSECATKTRSALTLRDRLTAMRARLSDDADLLRGTKLEEHIPRMVETAAVIDHLLGMAAWEPDVEKLVVELLEEDGPA